MPRRSLVASRAAPPQYREVRLSGSLALRLPRVRGLPTAVLAVLALQVLVACNSCPPEAAELTLRPDFRTPAAAGASFFAALGCDDAQAEYRAFGERLKLAHGADLSSWMLARAAVREELGPAVSHAHRLIPSREEVREDGVLVWWSAAGAERVGLLMQQQHYLELSLEDGRALGLRLAEPPGAWMRSEGKRLWIEMTAENSVLRGLDPARVTQVVIASEWKIADWVLPVVD